MGVISSVFGRLFREQVAYKGPLVPDYVPIFDQKLGHLRSRQEGQSIDMEGNALPWFTYPAIEFIKQLDLQDKEVLEWGAGNSTKFFSKRCKRIYSIEHNKEWFFKVKEFNLPNNNIFHAEANEKYVSTAYEIKKKFDLIVVDGILRDACLQAARDLLNESGMIIFDNSDRNPELAALMREKDLIQVDMHGLGPINNYTWTTSFFFSRKYNFSPLNLQPQIPIGGGF